MAAIRALVKFSCFYNTMTTRATLRTTKTNRPAPFKQRIGTLVFGPEHALSGNSSDKASFRETLNAHLEQMRGGVWVSH